MVFWGCFWRLAENSCWIKFGNQHFQPLLVDGSREFVTFAEAVISVCVMYSGVKNWGLSSENLESMNKEMKRNL